MGKIPKRIYEIEEELETAPHYKINAKGLIEVIQNKLKEFK